MRERPTQQLFDLRPHRALIEAAQEVDAVARRIAAMPILVDVLAHAEGRRGKIVREAEEIIAHRLEGMRSPAAREAAE